MMKRALTRAFALTVTGALVLGLAGSASATAETTRGNWDLYPAITSTYQAQVLQPLNNDGSSNISSGTTGVIPVRFTLYRQTQSPVVFQSINSDNPGITANDYSYLSFSPSTPMTFGDITNLSADFVFTQGQSIGGSMRWEIGTSAGPLYIYYGTAPSWTGTGGSGDNMIGQSDLRYDTSNIPGGSFYDTYAHAVTLLGSATVHYAAIVLDSGWAQGDQRVSLTSATVNNNTWLKGKFHVTELPTPGSFQVVKKDSTPRGAVNETLTVTGADTGALYRVNDAPSSYSAYPAYEYNLPVSSLDGPGTYKLTIKIGGHQVGSAKFDLTK
jgi:hypothetical protein